MTGTTDFAALVSAACRGDLQAFARLIESSHAMAYAVAWQVLRDESETRDAVQDAYLRAFRQLATLDQPWAFPGWMRRIVVRSALNRQRAHRTHWVPLDTVSAPPVLDEEERAWTEAQQRVLARALLTLRAEERRLCERHYYGGWSAERLAKHEGVDSAVIRKRLQRIRDKLREEIEMDEHKALGTRAAPRDLPATIIELLARPRLVDLPENPVGATLATLKSAFPDWRDFEVPEQVDLDAAYEILGGDAVYIDRGTLQRIEGERVLRYDLTLPLLLAVRPCATPTRLVTAGKVYRHEAESATHLQAFHQLEVFALDRRGAIDPWWLAARVLDAVDRALPRREVRLTPTDYPMCSRAFSLDVRQDDAWVELLAFGEYADWVLRALGAEPRTTAAVGAGFGLDRIAAMRYGIDDIRKLATAKIA